MLLRVLIGVMVNVLTVIVRVFQLGIGGRGVMGARRPLVLILVRANKSVRPVRGWGLGRGGRTVSWPLSLGASANK